MSNEQWEERVREREKEKERERMFICVRGGDGMHPLNNEEPGLGWAGLKTERGFTPGYGSGRYLC